MTEEGEEGYGALIYRESQSRKAEAEAAAAAKDAKKEKTSATASLNNAPQRKIGDSK